MTLVSGGSPVHHQPRTVKVIQEAPLSQMEDFIVMSRSGFSYSAAYTALPRRAAWLDKNAEDCSFIDYDGKCLGAACPGQMGDSHFARQAFNLGPYET